MATPSMCKMAYIFSLYSLIGSKTRLIITNAFTWWCVLENIRIMGAESGVIGSCAGVQKRTDRLRHDSALSHLTAAQHTVMLKTRAHNAMAQVHRRDGRVS